MDPIRESSASERENGPRDGVPLARGGYRVIVRLRPPSSAEGNCQIAVAATSRTRIRVLRSYQDPLELSFDRVFGPETEQAEVFPVVRDVVAAVVEGRNSTILAYGQTGSGKTHTMTGPGVMDSESAVWGALLGAERGIIPRTLEHLFSLVNKQRQADISGCTWKLHVSFMEIYNEKVYDLLSGPQAWRDQRAVTPLKKLRDSKARSTENDSAGLEIVEDRDGVVSVPGITVVSVDGLNQVLEVLRLGTQCRTYGDNGVNATSSRSHAVFQVNVEKLDTVDDHVLQNAKLNLVDLAGSEKIQPTESGRVTGVMLQELTAINLSLSTLGKCIAALVDSKRSHVPCRDSKLTRLLKDSFRGQSLTAMCICIAPTAATIEETLSSLKFADRAKRAVLDQRMDPKVTSKGARSQAQVAQLLAQVNELTAELSVERAERARLQGVIQQTSSIGGSISGLSMNGAGVADKVALYATPPGANGIPCFGDTPSSDSIDITDGFQARMRDARMRGVWDSDEELDQCSDGTLEAVKASSLMPGFTRGGPSALADFSPSHASDSCASAKNQTQMSQLAKRRALEYALESPSKSSHCGSMQTDRESRESRKEMADDHIANIDSRLKQLTGMLSDQGEELKKRLDTIEVLSVKELQREQRAARVASAPEPPWTAPALAVASVQKPATNLGNYGDSDNDEPSPKNKGKAQMSTLQMLRKAAEDPSSGAEDAYTPARGARELRDRDRAEPERAGKTYKFGASSDAEQVPSHPSQLSQRPKQPPKLALPPQPAELPRSARASPSPAPQGRSKTPPKTAVSPRGGNTKGSFIPPPPVRRPASSVSAKPTSSAAFKSPSQRPPPQRRSQPPAASRPGAKVRSSSQSSARSQSSAQGSCTSTVASNEPSSPRSRLANGAAYAAGYKAAERTNSSARTHLAAVHAGQAAPRGNSRGRTGQSQDKNLGGLYKQSLEDEDDFDAGASVLSTLSPEDRKVKTEMSLLEAEERKLEAELSGLSADENRVLGRAQSVGKERSTSQNNVRSRQPSPPAPPATKKESPPLRCRSDWTEIEPKAAAFEHSRRAPGMNNFGMVGKVLPATPSQAPTSAALFQDRAPLPWEKGPGAGKAPVRSNSSTSIGSTSIRSQRMYAGSDVSSSGVGSSTAPPKRPGSMPARPQPTGGPRRPSALDIANRCWQEFEGALSP